MAPDAWGVVILFAAITIDKPAGGSSSALDLRNVIAPTEKPPLLLATRTGDHLSTATGIVDGSRRPLENFDFKSTSGAPAHHSPKKIYADFDAVYAATVRVSFLCVRQFKQVTNCEWDFYSVLANLRRGAPADPQVVTNKKAPSRTVDFVFETRKRCPVISDPC